MFMVIVMMFIFFLGIFYYILKNQDCKLSVFVIYLMFIMSCIKLIYYLYYNSKGMGFCETTKMMVCDERCDKD